MTATQKSARRLIASRQLKDGPTSLANEFNKKLLEKGGGTATVNANELPAAAA